MRCKIQGEGKWGILALYNLILVYVYLLQLAIIKFSTCALLFFSSPLPLQLPNLQHLKLFYIFCLKSKVYIFFPTCNYKLIYMVIDVCCSLWTSSLNQNLIGIFSPILASLPQPMLSQWFIQAIYSSYHCLPRPTAQRKLAQHTLLLGLLDDVDVLWLATNAIRDSNNSNWAVHQYERDLGRPAESRTQIWVSCLVCRIKACSSRNQEQRVNILG